MSLCSYRNKIVDNSFQVNIGSDLPARPETFNQNGKPVGITLNTFNVDKAPKTVVHQYDVSNCDLPYISWSY